MYGTLAIASAILDAADSFKTMVLVISTKLRFVRC